MNLSKKIQVTSTFIYMYRQLLGGLFKRSAPWGRVMLFMSVAVFLLPSIKVQAQQSAAGVSALKVTTLNVNQRSGGILVGDPRPVLSWLVQQPAGIKGTGVSAYQLWVSDQMFNDKATENKPGWHSMKLTAGNLFSTNYDGPALKSNKTYYWQVKVWDAGGKPSAWSYVDSFQTGLFQLSDWKGAHWIGAKQMAVAERVLPGDTAVKDKTFGTVNDELPLFRKAFRTVITQRGTNAKKLKKAMLYITGLGQFEATINGQKIGDHFLDPGWTNYQKEALYVGFDLTDKILAGENVLGISLGNGFYYIPNVKQRYKKLLVQYGYPKMICRLSLDYSDGSHQDIVSDTSWKTAASSISFSSIYGGEDENGLLRQKGWAKPGFKPKQPWKSAILVTDTPKAVHLQNTDPVRFMETFSPVAIFKSGKHPSTTKVGTAAVTAKPAKRPWIYDMGQNCSGIPTMRVEGKKGDTIRLVPAELLAADSTANQRATGSPYYLQYIIGSNGIENWQPKFTYYGFRYVQIEGAVPAGKPNPHKLPVIRELTTLHMRNSAPQAGGFACSNELFNKTYELIRWGMKSNMMSVFTDCPHREKLGWLEQVHLMGNSVRYNWQIGHMLKKTIQDMRLSQTSSGLVPEIAPEFTVFSWGGNDMFRDSPEWGSSAIILPWYLYQWYGDSSALRESYNMMRRYIDYLQGKAEENILYQGLGDWYDLGPQHPGVSQLTPKGLTATAIYYYDLQILDKITGLLGKSADQSKYQQLATKVKASFNEKFLHQDTDSSGHSSVYYGTGSQTADAMALYMKLVPDSLRPAVTDHLVREIKNNHYALTAGDIGYHYLLSVLEAEGYSDVIFKMNNRTDVPGYGYQLAKGATALTESWQALSSVSNNHFMLGHLMQWFYAGVLGIRQAEGDVGCKNMIVNPQVVGDLTWAKGFYETPYGKLKVDWKKEGEKGGLSVRVHIPVGVQAKLALPIASEGPKTLHVTENGKSVTYMTSQLNGKNVAVVTVPSGDYRFLLEQKN